MNSSESERDAYYRYNYRVQSYEDSRILKSPPMTPANVAAISAAKKHFEQLMASIAAKRPLEPYKVDSMKTQLAYLETRYGDTRPSGIGINQGEYASIASADVNDSNRFMGTTGIIDCHALVLVARDAQGKVLQTLLAHIDAKTSIQRTMPELLASMPAGSQIDATVLGGPNGYNYYLQGDLVDALAKAPQVKHIRYNFDAATTVAVEVDTGRILTAAGPIEALSKVKTITRWPVDFKFPEFSNELGLEIGMVAHQFFRMERQVPAFGLHRAYDAKAGFINADVVDKFAVDRLLNDGKLDKQELSEIAGKISSELNAPVTLSYKADAAGAATIDIIAKDGKKLTSFTSPKLDAALGASGIITPANTPLAPGRALSTNTR